MEERSGEERETVYLTYSALAATLAGMFLSAYLVVYTKVKERADRVTNELQSNLKEKIRNSRQDLKETQLREIIQLAIEVGRPGYYVNRCCKSFLTAGMLMLSTTGLCLMLEGLDVSIVVWEVDVLLTSLRVAFAFAISTAILGFIYLHKLRKVTG